MKKILDTHFRVCKYEDVQIITGRPPGNGFFYSQTTSFPECPVSGDGPEACDGPEQHSGIFFMEGRIMAREAEDVDLAVRKLGQIKAMADLFSHWGEKTDGKLVSIPAESLVEYCGAIEDLAEEAVNALLPKPAPKQKAA